MQDIQISSEGGIVRVTYRGVVEYGATTKEAVWSDGKVVLYRYRGETKPTARVPLLISYALVNRPYMVDLQEDRSIVRGLLARGEDVYIIDWGYPDRSDRYLTLEDYVERFLGGAIDYLRPEDAEFFTTKGDNRN